MKRFLFILLLLVAPHLSFCEEPALKRSLDIQGTFLQYKWSPDSRFLAVLYLDREGVSHISLIRTWNGRLFKDYSFSYPVNCFDWMDQSTLLLGKRNPDYSSDLTRFIIRKGQSVEWETDLQRLYFGITAITIAPHTNLWAITYSVEGMVDTAVYEYQREGLRMLFHTEVYGGVYSRFWHGGLLYCQSFVDLEIGLREKDRLQYFMDQEWGREAEYYNSYHYMGNEVKLYGIDIHEQKAYAARQVVLQENQFSFNRKYKIAITSAQGDPLFRVLFYHIR